MRSFGYAAMTAGAPLVPYTFERRDPGPSDVVLDLMYCGMCHSDLHFINDDWGISRLPLVPGHEIVGRVRSVGAEVRKFTVGDVAAIGCMVESCRQCSACKRGEEHACSEGFTPTYSGVERSTGELTFGGYSTNYVVHEDFALTVPAALDPAAAAPLLCAGVTTYSPLKYWGVDPGSAWESSAWAGWGTSRSNSPRLSAPRSWCSPRRRRNATMRFGWVRTMSSFPPTVRR
jgi:uncharacterized zinc-type alcohol dehydrogenase-like protein